VTVGFQETVCPMDSYIYVTE